MKTKRMLSLLAAGCLLCGAAAAEDAGTAAQALSFADTAGCDNNIVFYEIFTGSFSDSDGDGVGDLRGVINRLDYLNDGDPLSGKSLGVEGIWLTPVFLSPSYHKYDVSDYRQIDPQFGTMADLEELIGECHSRGIRLILDLPVNHTGTDCEWFRRFAAAHERNDPGDPYYDFYVWAEKDDVPRDRVFCALEGTDICYEANFSPSMPEMNFDSEAVRQAVLDTALCYLDMGVDGFRFDAAKYIYLNAPASSVAFWQWYTDSIRAVHPDAYLVAEVWDNDAVIRTYDGCVNCFAFAASQSEGWIAKAAKGGNVDRFTSAVSERLEALRAARADAQLVLFISNHDMDRAAGYLSESTGQARMAANLYLLSPGSPFIYYGEEIGLKGSRGAADSDANRRAAMRWGDGDTVRDPEETTYDPANQTKNTVSDAVESPDSLYAYYQRLLQIRREHPEIAGGAYTPLTLPDTKAGGFISARQGSEVLVLHNTGKKAVSVSLADAGADRFRVISAVIGKGDAALSEGTVTLDAQTTVLLRTGE